MFERKSAKDACPDRLPKNLLWPRFWIPWCLVAIFRTLACFPYRIQLVLGKQGGRLLYLFAPRARHVASVNLALCFQQHNPAERSRLLKSAFESIGVGLFEANLGWWASDRRLPPCTIIGLEHLRQSLEQGRGVILCSAHFVTWELAGRYINRQIPADVVYRPQKHPVLEWVAKRCRSKHYRKMIRADDFRGMLESLKSNRLVWYTPDIDPGRRRKGVFVPFCGVSAYTTTALARLARLSGAPVVPGFPYRRKDGTGFELVLDPPLEGFPSNDIIHDTARVNELIEQAVRRCPEQYLWQYKRFKTRPSGEMRIYGR